ncbi:metal-sensitive transcriptional regulator, partial [Acidiphilium sp.]|uniref:metal-sensitive transcriptional regulator n=1 Tax=Acidiphilium sp. TaxID=527 RepID=UPI003D08BF04
MIPSPVLESPPQSQAAARNHQIVNRLRRAQGQLDAVIRAVEANEPCDEVVTQLSAVLHAIERAGFKVVAEAMHECVSGGSGDGH